MRKTKRLRKHRQRQASGAVTCRDVTDLSGDYLAEGLAGAAQHRIEAHLSACPDCTAFLSTYRRTIALTKSVLKARWCPALPVELKLRLPLAS